MEEKDKMQKFNKSNVNELKDFIYYGFAHDALLKEFTCDGNGESARIEFFHPYFKIKTTMVFNDIEVVLATKGNWGGERGSISSLTVEDDFSYLQTYLPTHSGYSEDSLYLLFQMFSGDELHIVAKEVMAVNIKDA